MTGFWTGYRRHFARTLLITWIAWVGAWLVLPQVPAWVMLPLLVMLLGLAAGIALTDTLHDLQTEADEKLKRESRTHDYTRAQRMWGHDLNYTPIEGGQVLDAVGWGYGIEVGDRILLSGVDVGDTTCYTVERIRYSLDPRDMWFAKLRFTPRSMEQKAADHALVGLMPKVKKGRGDS